MTRAIGRVERSSEALRGHQRPSEANRGHQRPSEAISVPINADAHCNGSSASIMLGKAHRTRTLPNTPL